MFYKNTTLLQTLSNIKRFVKGIQNHLIFQSLDKLLKPKKNVYGSANK